MWAKVYEAELNMEVVWVDGVFARNLALLAGQCSAEKPVLLLRRHSEEAQLAGCILVMLPFYP